ncbi:MAG: 50S ribosomal protein L11 methyltransferase [Lachnospiraceae bacterium]|nr:50S ribosomal protein L11 methyltransferase [Lachnospiraceae bacterium]
MKWKKLTLETTTEALDYMAAIADEVGLSGFEVEDNVPLTEEEERSLFAVITPELPPDDGTAKVIFYIDEDADERKIAEDIKAAVGEYEGIFDPGPMTFTFSETEEKDWVDNWKQFFKPFRVDDHILIKPTWEEACDAKPDDLVIEIDPGTAFGTGAHETTKLCIAGLKDYLKPGDRVLDVGTGSGILSILSMKLGAYGAIGTDIDDNAVHTSVENTLINNIPAEYFEKENANLEEGRVCFTTGDVIEDGELRKRIGEHSYDIVVANILAPVIIELCRVAGSFMKKDAYFITSGIINTAEEDVKKALLLNGFKIVEVKRMKDWVGFISVLS